MKNRVSFFKVLKNNLQCAFCKEEKCYARYMPEKQQTWRCGGNIYGASCKKDREKQLNRMIRKWK